VGDTLESIIDGLAVYRLSRLVARDTFPPVAHARTTWLEAHPLPGTLLPNPVDKKNCRVGNDGSLHGTITYVVPGWLGLGTRVSARASTPDPELGWYADGSPLGELIDCSACNSVWLAAGVVFLRRFTPRFWSPIAALLASSAVAALLSSHE